jgi:hypothetical protein
MIYFGASPRNFPVLDPNNPIHTTPRDDDLFVLRASGAAELEALVNAEGQRQDEAPDVRALVGIQLGGSGQGSQFACTMLFTHSNAPGQPGDGMRFPSDDPADGPGIRCFFFKAETEEELTVQMDAAIARAEAFGAGTSGMEWRGFEISGGSFGGEHMGMLIAYRDVPV